jgi:hypothetical protein
MTAICAFTSPISRRAASAAGRKPISREGA